MPHALIARQPIVDADVHVRGYELLFRSASRTGAEGFDGEVATATVAMNTLLDLGLRSVAGEHPVFVNMTRAFLERELYVALPPDRVVLEVLEGLEPDAALIAAVQRARDLGYRIALDDYVHEERLLPLVALADVVKVDAEQMDDEGLRAHARILQRPGLELLAEKIETRERFHTAREAGYDLFQGWFYARPGLLRRRSLRADRSSLLHLLCTLEDPDADFDQIGEVVEQNVALSYKMLRYVNSVLVNPPQPIESIRHACTLLGLERVRTCVMLLLLADMEEKPHELMHNALSRARMCQLLAPSRRTAVEQKYFTVGLFSLLDAYLDRDLEHVLEELPVSDEVRDAIVANVGAPGEALRAVVACERADWQALLSSSHDPFDLQRAYVSALNWSREVERALQEPPADAPAEPDEEGLVLDLPDEPAA